MLFELVLQLFNLFLLFLAYLDFLEADAALECLSIKRYIPH
jgi:hypothetical protein